MPDPGFSSPSELRERATGPSSEGPVARSRGSDGLGIVAIGRNEGERLRRCLQSLSVAGSPICYVDSGSTDGSVALAESFGAIVVPLDLSVPFTAARARNTGWRTLLARRPDLAFVFFIDGDCDLDPTFLPTALAVVNADGKLAAVAGRLHERSPDASIYNRLCDLEWDAPTGIVEACGGIAVYRVSALQQADGFRESMIAGEEPELCTRLRSLGWRIERIAAPMATHDAAMTRFGQWWKRAERAGHACAEGASLHPTPPFSLWRREVRSNWAWGLGLPLLALLLAWPTRGLSLAGALALVGVLFWRVRRRERRSHGTLYAAFVVLGKLPAALGQVRFYVNRRRGRRTRLMEYKDNSAKSFA